MAKTLKILKWLATGIVAIIVILLLAISAISQFHISRSHEAKPVPAAALTGGDPVEGKRFSAVYGCSGCHRPDLQGGKFVDEALLATVYASNLTRKLEQYGDAEFVQAVRQGMRPDGSGLVIMPSQAFAVLRDSEMADILAYLHSVPAAGEDHPHPSIGPMARAFFTIGEFGTAPAMAEEWKDRMPWFVEGHEEGRRIVIAACGECHGSDLTGESFAGAPDLSIAAAYDLDGFTRLMRTGRGASERDLGLMAEVSQGRFAHFTEDEIAAIHGYLVARAEKVN